MSDRKQPLEKRLWQKELSWKLILMRLLSMLACKPVLVALTYPKLKKFWSEIPSKREASLEVKSQE